MEICCTIPGLLDLAIFFGKVKGFGENLGTGVVPGALLFDVQRGCRFGLGFYRKRP